ncbi:MAG: HalX domain-containing protein [Halobacteriales archaeon]
MSDSHDPPSVSVLVVDDERGLADLYTAWLSDSYDVTTAYSGTEALAKINTSIDVVFLDRRMPKLSGDAVLSGIRENGYDCYVAMLTAVTPDFDIIDLALDYYLLKPVSQCDLHRTIERFLDWEEYNECLQELCSLVATRAALAAEKSEEELQANPAYRQLVAEIESLQTEVDEFATAITEDEFGMLSRAIENNRSGVDADCTK